MITTRKKERKKNHNKENTSMQKVNKDAKITENKRATINQKKAITNIEILINVSSDPSVTKLISYNQFNGRINSRRRKRI